MEIRARQIGLEEEFGFNSKFQAMRSSQQALGALAGTMAPPRGHSDLYLEEFPFGAHFINSCSLVGAGARNTMIDIG